MSTKKLSDLISELTEAYDNLGECEVHSWYSSYGTGEKTILIQIGEGDYLELEEIDQ